MAKEIKEGKSVYWVDGEGYKVPVKYISKDDQARDELVCKVISDVIALHKQIAEFRVDVFRVVDNHLNKVAHQHGEDWRGNAWIYDFSKEKAIEVKINKRLAFDERLQLAKTKIDNYIKGLVKQSGKEIVMLINKAFNVDKRGNVDVQQILGLRQLKIEHPEWQEAMALIDEATQVEFTKKYLTFKVKDDTGEWNTISLNFSAL